MIKVSVVVPVYNVEPFLRQCIDSLLNQTIENIEIILINDCSTDNSGAVCDEYAANDPRVRIIHNNHNLGQGLSRYKGISLSQGKYIGFVDADDFIDEDFYNELLKFRTYF